MGRSRSCSWPVWAASAVIVVLASAGLLKLFDLGSFADALRSWVLVPAWLRSLAVVAVPLTEATIGVLWLARIRRKILAVSALGLLAVFCSVYLAHLLTVGPPQCACFGLMRDYIHTRDQGASVILRNAVLASGLIPYLLIRPGAKGV